MKRVRICPECDKAWKTDSDYIDEICEECIGELNDLHEAQDALEEME